MVVILLPNQVNLKIANPVLGRLMIYETCGLPVNRGYRLLAGATGMAFDGYIEVHGH